MANILIITHWTGGDVFPFVKMGRGLKKLGHTITIFTHCYYKNIVEKSGMNFVPVDNMDEFIEMTNSFHMLSDPIYNLDKVLEFNEKFHGKEKLLREVGMLCEYCIDSDTIIIARHRSSVSGILAAEVMKVPVMSVFLAPNYLAHLDLHEIIMGKAMCEEINKARRVLKLNTISNWTDWMCSANCLVGTWPEWYSVEEENRNTNIKKIGFIIEEVKGKEKLPEKVKKVVEDSKPVILITGGTSTMIDPNFYKVAIDSCTNLNVNVILVTPFEFLIPVNLPKNVFHLKSANISQIIKKASVVVHHGGIGTMCECIENGVAQIVLPNYADRPDNAYRIQEMGLGISYARNRWKAELIEEGIKKHLRNSNKSILLSYQKKIISDDAINNLNALISDLI